jgi:divalent metal cation (Fe/Co/Zn/Cd) transporter
VLAAARRLHGHSHGGGGGGGGCCGASHVHQHLERRTDAAADPGLPAAAAGAASSGGAAEAAANTKLAEERNRDCRRITLVGGGVNLALCAIKISVGTTGGSVALVADGLHAFVDFASDGVSYAAVAASRWTSSRCRFPFGLGRIETVGAVFVSVLLLSGAATLVWQSVSLITNGVRSLPFSGLAPPAKPPADHGHSHGGGCDHGHSHSGIGHSHFELVAVDAETGIPTVAWAMVGIALAALGVKEALYRVTRRIGERAGSKVVVANAFHHRADAWCSGVALVGVVGGIAGLPAVDALAALGVSWVIGRMGWRLLQGSVLEFFDYQSGELDDLRQAIRAGADRVRREQPAARCCAVNGFATRHGHQFALYGTIIAARDAPCQAVGELEAAIRGHVNTTFTVSLLDSFFTVHVVDSFAGDAASFRAAVATVAAFHQLPMDGLAIEWFDAARPVEGDAAQAYGELRLSGAGAPSGDCVADLRAVADAFACRFTDSSGDDAAAKV